MALSGTSRLLCYARLAPYLRGRGTQQTFSLDPAASVSYCGTSDNTIDQITQATPVLHRRDTDEKLSRRMRRGPNPWSQGQVLPLCGGSGQLHRHRRPACGPEVQQCTQVPISEIDLYPPSPFEKPCLAALRQVALTALLTVTDDIHIDSFSRISRALKAGSKTQKTV